MANILSFSSQVVRGSVGNSVTAFALQRMGHTVWQVPTVLFSNHPGHGAFAGRATEAQEMQKLWTALVSHGWDRDVDAVLTGYMPSNTVVEAVADVVRELKSARPDLVYLCDPAIGDEPKGLYVAENVAIAIRDLLLPLADFTTPNRFELSWLTGEQIADSAVSAGLSCGSLDVDTVVATSIPGETDDRIANVLCRGSGVVSCATERLTNVPHGTGDLFGALYLSGMLKNTTAEQALGIATAAVQSVLDASRGFDELQLVASQDRWCEAEYLPVVVVA